LYTVCSGKTRFFWDSCVAQDDKNKKNSHISIILRGGVALIACCLIALKLDFREVAKVFSNISVWVLGVVVAAFLVSQTILAFRWWLFMRSSNIQIPLWSAIKLTFLGLYFNNFLPGSIGGDLVRAWYVAKHTHRRMAAVISVFVDRLLALLATILMALTGVILAGQEGLFVANDKNKDYLGLIKEYRGLILAVLAVVVLLAVGLAVVPAIRIRLKLLYKKALHHAKSVFVHLLEVGMLLLKKPLLGPVVLLLTFLLQGLVILSMWFLGMEMGIPTPMKLYFVFLPVMWVIGSVPISIAGIGIMEGGLIVLFTQFGGATTDEQKAAVGALVLFQRAVWIIASLPGLGVHLSGKHLPSEIGERFSIDDNQEIN